MSDRAPLALITGASGGIGRAFARQFVAHGFDVLIAAEDDELNEAAAELAISGRTVIPVRADLSRGEGVEDLYERVLRLGRQVNAAVLNAGGGVGGRFDDTPLHDDLRLVDLNCRSTVHLAKLVVRHMLAGGEGRIMFTASIVAKAPGPYHATHAASKAFVHSFAEALRVEVADSGITVTSLMPGPTETEFFSRDRMKQTRVGSGPKDGADAVAADGFAAMMSGRDHVVAGDGKSRLMAAVSTALPDALAARAQANQSKPGSAS